MGTSTIKVGMGEGVVAGGPAVLWSAGVGSCVVVGLYYARRSVGGLAHVMLPGPGGAAGGAQVFRCGDTAVAPLLEGLRGRGARPRDLVAKIAGGARMFSTYGSGCDGIGAQNLRSVKEVLAREGIPLVGWDVAGRHGRSVEFHLATGRLVVRALGKEDRQF